MVGAYAIAGLKSIQTVGRHRTAAPKMFGVAHLPVLTTSCVQSTKQTLRELRRKKLNMLKREIEDIDGLSRLQTIMLSGQQAPMANTMNFALVHVEKGRTVFEGTPSAAFYNPIGSVHGGYAATLLDSACACAVQSSITGQQGFTTLDLNVSFHRALSDRSGPVRAEGRVLTIGRRIAFAEANLVDSEGRLCASATSTLLVFDLETMRK